MLGRLKLRRPTEQRRSEKDSRQAL
jgi:hypothetical protein